MQMRTGDGTKVLARCLFVCGLGPKTVPYCDLGTREATDLFPVIARKSETTKLSVALPIAYGRSHCDIE